MRGLHTSVLHTITPRTWWDGQCEDGYHIYGGTSRMTGVQSSMRLNTIIPVRSEKGERLNEGFRSKVSLCNKTLFRRDQHVCAYCGNQFVSEDLSRDHVAPRARW